MHNGAAIVEKCAITPNGEHNRRRITNQSKAVARRSKNDKVESVAQQTKAALAKYNDSMARSQVDKTAPQAESLSSSHQSGWLD